MDAMDRTEDFVELVRVRMGEDRLVGASKERNQDELELAAEEVGRSVEGLVGFVSSAKKRYEYLDDPRGMSSEERAHVDETVSRLLKDAVGQLDALKAAAVRRIEAGKEQAGSWTGQTEAAASHAAFGTHILGVVMILNDQLQTASRMGDHMRSVRIRHELENSGGDEDQDDNLQGSFGDWTPFLPPLGSQDKHTVTQKDITDDIQNPQLVQAFQEENDELQAELVDTLNQVRQAERTIAEVAALNQLFATKVLEQAHEIEKLYDDAVKTNFFIRRGNRELKEMKQSGNRVVQVLSLLVLGLALLLLFFDFLF